MMNISLSDVLNRTLARAKATKNVLSPLQWFLPFVMGSFTLLVLFGPAEYRLASFVCLSCSPIFFFFFYAFFAVKDPKRLQSEDHVETMTLLAQTYEDDRGMLLVGSAAANTAAPTVGQVLGGPSIAASPSASPAVTGPSTGSANPVGKGTP
jgi:hypothetical protein